MKKVFLLLVLSLILSGCEYAAGSLPEKACIKADNLTIVNNDSGIYVANGQIELELNGCNTNITIE